MWHQVTVPFGRLLGEHLYPALFANPDYQKFLDSAGVHPPYPATAADLTVLQQKALSQNAEMRAHLLGLELEGLRALERAKAKAVELVGPLRLYRLYNSKAPKASSVFSGSPSNYCATPSRKLERERKIVWNGSADSLPSPTTGAPATE